MIRPLYAFLGAVALLVGWLAVVAVQAGGDPAAIALSLGDSAQRSHLPGLAARAYLLSADQERRRLRAPGMDRNSAAGQVMIRHIIATRMAAARLLLQGGYVAAAERLALEGARADFDDLQARALLLEVRLTGDEPEAARRELMLLLLKEPHPQLLYLLGSSLAHDGAIDDAVACYERALKVKPDHVPSLLALADARTAQHQPEAAAKLLQQAASAAQSADERDLVASATKRSAATASPVLQALSVWWSTHSISVLLALAYLLFLISPALVTALKRRG